MLSRVFVFEAHDSKRLAILYVHFSQCILFVVLMSQLHGTFMVLMPSKVLIFTTILTSWFSTPTLAL